MVSIIIPVYNEENNINAFQEELNKLKGDFEVIFSDGGSTDNTYDLIKYPKIRETNYRSNQMNAGAKYAKGDYLWFVHCDSKLSPNSVLAIENSASDVGCFTTIFMTDSLFVKFIQFCTYWRVKLRKIMFGDQGIFIKKNLFEEIGGFKPIEIMEDYQFSMDLKKFKIPVKMLSEKIFTSDRKYLTEGGIRTLLKMQRLQRDYRRGRNPKDIEREY